jgi:hypothetical protein
MFGGSKRDQVSQLGSGAIKAKGSKTLPPRPGGAIKGFARIGYQLEEAIADVIDNSIDANASRIEVTLSRNEERITEITIADNGDGMDERQLREAMRIGSNRQRKNTELGMFGAGMKYASFSQCKSLSVISRQRKKTRAFRWSLNNIDTDWTCEILDRREAVERFSAAFSPGACPPEHGTVLLWENLDRLATPQSDWGLDEFLADHTDRLLVWLGLVFHRFLQPGKIDIILKTANVNSQNNSHALPQKVWARDPFGYHATGVPGYPKVFLTELPGVGALSLNAHIWPFGSHAPGFVLGERNGTEHQGLYFYRNDRLVQSGTWSGYTPVGSLNELSLARVSIDLPNSEAQLVNIQKTGLQVTAALPQALERARCGDLSFAGYLEQARAAFRSGRAQLPTEQVTPVVPGAGLPKPFRRFAQGLLGNAGDFTEVDFAWEDLDDDKVFDVRAEKKIILLNRKYRSKILNGTSASSADAPFVKTMLFLLLRDELDRVYLSVKYKNWLDSANALLLQAIKCQ